MTGGNLHATAEQGRSLLTPLLGTSAMDALSGAIGKFGGLGQGSVATLLGFLGPVVMAVLGRQRRTAGLDQEGLARLVTDQKGAIANALPADLGNLLGGSGVLTAIRDRLGQGMGAASPAAGSAADAAHATVSDIGTAGNRTAGNVGQAASSPPRQGAIAPGWLLGLAAAIALAVLGYWMLGRQEAPQVARQTTGQFSGTSTPPSVVIGQTDLAKQLTGTLDTTTHALQGITDATSASNALPQLTDATSQLERLQGLLPQVPESGRKILTDVVGQRQPELQQLIDKVLAKPGIPDTLKPALDSFQAKLKSIASA
jgi:hypothetical protein